MALKNYKEKRKGKPLRSHFGLLQPTPSVSTAGLVRSSPFSSAPVATGRPTSEQKPACSLSPLSLSLHLSDVLAPCLCLTDQWAPAISLTPPLPFSNLGRFSIYGTRQLPFRDEFDLDSISAIHPWRQLRAIKAEPSCRSASITPPSQQPSRPRASPPPETLAPPPLPQSGPPLFL